ncbi:hypothetical protein [Paracidovorax citrulli]|uniref:Uncharacterized protein n=1 Tax=Paracidovorax citrulli TaxID=80869 RepID=A0ABY9AK29_PARCI|nr:hypothetical protein [Paracidovorax citrulli]PVY63042.1 hypothetical protein C8E08_0312 [Paracidovorax citrulli]REG67975.1 hypothetical protein C8E07_1067 [Paracidovorax citrulli]RLJ92534.1 hypothetical protein C8E06_1068 [Paracidovorax citrulli]WIY31876.1 hypothetical protein QRO09_09210 [Paracidovorax citrulli]WIY41151.1 hypothetical protein QRO10_09475 [Paracidovorax citrulli]
MSVLLIAASPSERPRSAGWPDATPLRLPVRFTPVPFEQVRCSV